MSRLPAPVLRMSIAKRPFGMRNKGRASNQSGSDRWVVRHERDGLNL